jgi:GAF domain-containing protein
MFKMRSSVNLDDVLITSALAQRLPRTPNLQAENQALHTVARQLAEQSETMLKTLVTVAKDLCQAGTAGVSLLETTPNGEEVFRWSALAGALAGYEGETTPRSFSPCGLCLDRQAPQLYSYPERYFTYFQRANPVIIEGLVIPLIAGAYPTGGTVSHRSLGTIWVVSHDEARQFDLEDVRLLTSLADFTAASLQSIHLRQTAETALQHEQTARQEAD